MRITFKDLLLPFALAWAISWGVQYFFFKENKSSVEVETVQWHSGKSFLVVDQGPETMPLDKTISIEPPLLKHEKITTVRTNKGSFTFSSIGARLVDAEFLMSPISGSNLQVHTIRDIPQAPESWAFLVAFNENTPINYELVSHTHTGDVQELVYRTHNEQGIIEKKYKVHNDSYEFDIDFTITPRATEAPIVPRIFVPEPYMQALEGRDTISGIYESENKAVRKIAQSNINERMGWITPTLFGIDNRYFAHVLINNSDTFVKRGYFGQYLLNEMTGENTTQHSLTKPKMLVAILEGPAVQEKTTWHLSFYVGPKQQSALIAVDNRLEGILNYSGILSFISQLLLKLLNYLYYLLGNYGFAIIAMTVLMKLMTVPFTANPQENARRRAKYQHQLEEIEHKYKGNPQLLAQHKATLLKEQGLSGLASCLPMLLPLPIFFALAPLLGNAIELYQAPFIGWIHDLSARDPYFILPIITMVTMLVQAFFMDANMRTVFIGTALLLGFFSFNFSAGLALYACVNALFTFVQTILQRAFSPGK